MVNRFHGRDSLMNHLEGVVNIDSDCEDDSVGLNDGILNEENEEESRAVLITWSFSVCVRFLASPSC